MNDTIFALATAPGRAPVAVIRISGPESRHLLDEIAGGAPSPRRASLRRLRDARGVTLDRALVLWFPGPRSYTAEDCAELHLHGGMAIVDAVTRALLDAGARLAKPGEFTRRAFEHGKLELDQAEAVGDLVDAETESQAKQALNQLEGALGRRYQSWREVILGCLADLEAIVDFPDEEVPAETIGSARLGLSDLIDALDKALGEEARGRQVREGYRIAIIGAPNAGKSSLLNRLVGRSAAIVNDAAGTTRDVVEVPMVISGYRVVLADMAGLRETTDVVEAEGVARATAWASDAALRLWVVDGAARDGCWRQAAGLVRAGDLCLINKSDLLAGSDGQEARHYAASHDVPVIGASMTAGQESGINEFLLQRVVQDLGGTDFPAATRARHGELLRDARFHLRRAIGAITTPELAAEDVRLAARALARVTGRVGVEDVLDRVFATFCIGK